MHQRREQELEAEWEMSFPGGTGTTLDGLDEEGLPAQ